MKKTLVIAIIIILVIFGCNTFITRKNSKAALQQAKIAKKLSLENKQSANGQDKIIPVKIMVLQEQNFTANVKTVATLKAKEDYVISAKLGGEVTYLNAEIGMKVKKGQLIARIDPDMVEATLRQAQANYELAASTYKRQKNLFEKKLISDQQIEGAATQFKVAQASLSLAKINFNNSKIVSPINGVIAEKYIDLYETAGPGKQIVRIVNTDKMEAEVGVNELSIVRIRKGNDVTIKLSAYPELVITGDITHVGTQANQDTKTFPVLIEFDNKNGIVKGGMIADISILLDTYQNAVVIPFSLVEQSGNGNYVYLEENGIAVRRDIELGDAKEDVVRVIKGLKKGDHLIIEGNKYVAENSKVNVIE
ncbi:MAG: efflux RND transporter periplasmic adaptor subunit [Candidatus Margulisbacteria bacterium]|nr:efflux RND transporter periplasmic adaptor subunit [Candidatus Margulisiibacteriota bacterium]